MVVAWWWRGGGVAPLFSPQPGVRQAEFLNFLVEIKSRGKAGWMLIYIFFPHHAPHMSELLQHDLFHNEDFHRSSHLFSLPTSNGNTSSYPALISLLLDSVRSIGADWRLLARLKAPAHRRERRRRRHATAALPSRGGEAHHGFLNSTPASNQRTSRRTLSRSLASCLPSHRIRRRTPEIRSVSRLVCWLRRLRSGFVVGTSLFVSPTLSGGGGEWGADS